MKRSCLSYYSYDSIGNPWVSGGGAVRDFEMLKRFNKAHVDVTLYVGGYPGFREETREGIRIRKLGGGKSESISRLTFSMAANIRILFDRAKIIGNSASVYAPILAGILRPKRFYAVYHHYAGKHAVERHGVLGWIPCLLEQLMLRFGRSYVISNATVAEKVRGMNPRAKVFTTFNGFDPGLLTLQHRPANPPFILFVGRFDIYMKGLDLLIPAFAEVAEQKEIDLVLAGRASQDTLTKIRNLIPETLKNRVRLEIAISDERKAELLASCLFFCSPSRFEGFGIAALEANAAGKADLVTNADGFRDSLALGKTALAVPIGDVSALKSAMLRLIEDENLREELGRSGRERARAFSWDSIAGKEWAWIAEFVLKGDI